MDRFRRFSLAGTIALALGVLVVAQALRQSGETAPAGTASGRELAATAGRARRTTGAGAGTVVRVGASAATPGAAADGAEAGHEAGCGKHAGGELRVVELEGSAALTVGAGMDAPTTAAGFIELLRDLGRRDREDAVDPETVDAVLEDIARLLTQDPAPRAAALAAFGVEEDAGALELMALAFGRVGLPDVRAGLAEIARLDGAVERRGFALSALGMYQAAECVPVALAVLRGQPPAALAERAIEALPDLPPTGLAAEERGQVVRQLASLTQSGAAEVRVAAYRALADWDQGGATPALVAGLADPELVVRATAAYGLALSAEKDGAARGALLRLLADPREHVEVRGTAADGLRNWGGADPEVRRAVIAFYDAEARAAAGEPGGAAPAEAGAK
ncbi:MAG: HEAT repeat domain-containing protein [Planctomycetes bacterium]|nr:HEAT repeat domain-containing protein [Planctomycetota bacterium]